MILPLDGQTHIKILGELIIYLFGAKLYYYLCERPKGLTLNC